MFRSLILTSSMLLPSLAVATVDARIEPVYAEAGQYTASLSARTQSWRLSPLVGQAIDVRPGELCPHTAVPPKGMWIVGRDDSGQPQLVAPSATLLPEGHAGQVALRACDDPELRDSRVAAYGVPRQVLQWLADQSGAVLVND